MKVYVQGKKPVNLDPSDYKQGGEAKVWIDKKIVYKIYHDSKHMIPLEKIQELQAIEVDNVVVPKDLILNSRKKPIGFTMDKAIGDPLIKLHTTGFRNTKGIINDHIVALIEMIKKVILEVHELNCLLVDINDLNIIVEPSWTVGNFIDINSWQTPSFPATAINPNVRDWSSKTFTTLTDWYSFAIITCYLFVGIHPFRGSHKKYNRSDVEGRMRDHVSIFNSDVRLPKSVRDFSLIPDYYRKWYIELFENGKRNEPPLLPGTVTIVSVMVKLIKSTDSFKIKFLQRFDSDIIFYKEVFGREIIRTKKSIYINKDNYQVNPGVDIIITEMDVIPVLVKIEDNTLKLRSLSNNKDVIYPVLNASDIMIVNNALFIINDGDIIELGFTDMRNKVIVSVDSTWSIMSNTHEVFDGVIYQLIMGRSYVVIPVPKMGEKTMYIEKEIQELDGYKIINAKHESGVLMVTGFKRTTYDLFIIRFNSDYTQFHCRKIEDVDLEDLNFISLANGMCVSIFADNTLEIFRRDPMRPKVNKIEDSAVDSTMKLCKKGVEVRFFKENKLYSIQMK